MTLTETPTTTKIAAEDLRQLIHEDDAIRILDVRTSAEYESVHIPGSFNMPLGTLTQYAREVAAVDPHVVLVCQSGARAADACTKLTAQGKTQVQVLDGGIAAWESAGGDVVRGVEKWALDRQVRLAAGSVVLASLLASTVLPKTKWLAAGIGTGLVYSAVTNSCAITRVFEKLPYNQTEACDVDGVLADLNA